MLNPKGFSDLPLVTPTMAEDLCESHLIDWVAEYRSDLTKVVMLANLLGLERQDDMLRLSASLAALDREATYRRDRMKVVGEAYAILQGVS